MGKFVISKRTNGEFQFNLKADNGQVILTSEGYSSKAGCENGISSVKTNSQDDSKFDRKTSSNGKPYFNLKASNGQIIGTSDTCVLDKILAYKEGLKIKVNESAKDL